MSFVTLAKIVFICEMTQKNRQISKHYEQVIYFTDFVFTFLGSPVSDFDLEANEQNSHSTGTVTRHRENSGGSARHREISEDAEMESKTDETYEQNNNSNNIHTVRNNSKNSINNNNNTKNSSSNTNNEYHFEPLTNYSIAAIAAANKKKRITFDPATATGTTNNDLDSTIQNDHILNTNTANNKYSSPGTAAAYGTAIGNLMRRSSFPYNQAHLAANNTTNNNMNMLLQQIGVNTAEAATVMINLIKVKQNKSKHSLAMVI